MDDWFTTLPRILRIVPPLESIKTRKTQVKLQGFLMVLILIGAALYGFRNTLKFAKRFPEVYYQIIIFDITNSAPMATAIVTLIARSHLISPMVYLNLRKNFGAIDKVLKNRGFHLEKPWMRLRFCVMNIGYMVLKLFGMVVYKDLKNPPRWVEIIISYYWLTIINMIYGFIYDLEIRLKILHEIVENITDINCKEINEWNFIYRVLVSISRGINGLLGWNAFFLLLFWFFRILRMAGAYTIQHRVHVLVGLINTIQGFFMMLFEVMLIVLIVRKSENLKVVTRRILASITGGFRSPHVGKTLMLFGQHIKSNEISFVAAGIFTVDYTVLFILLQILSAYIVLVVTEMRY